MIRIGDFSKLGRVSVKTLRYYDEVGLLVPIEVDRFTGYRLYDYQQLPRLYRILALKDLGFSLDEIRQLLASELPSAQLHGMLRLRQAEIERRVVDETERLARVQRWLNQIEQEDRMTTYDVMIKPIEALSVASIRATVPTPPDQGALWEALMGAIGQQGGRMVGAPIAIYHDPEYRERDWDIEVCMPVADGMRAAGQLALRQLPAVEHMAAVVHAGPFETISQAYDSIAKWIDASGYRIAGPGREVILRPPAPDGNQSDAQTVVEVQFPVASI